MQRLEQAQKAALVQWITEGYNLHEINRRASEFDSPFQVPASMVGYYRAKFAIDLNLLTQEVGEEAIQKGLGSVAERKRLLELGEAVLREAMFEDGLFMVFTRTGPKFNAPLYREWRGTLDDIAREVGGRRQGIDANVETVALTLEEWRDLRASRVSQAERVLQEFEE